MKRMFSYLGMALAACLSCFSIGAMADPLASSYSVARLVLSVSEPQGVALQRLQLTLAQWRSQTQSGTDSNRSDMRAASNGFVFNGLPVQHAITEPALT